MGMFARFILCGALLAAFSASAAARTLDAVVTHVSDGDTFWVRPAGARAELPRGLRARHRQRLAGSAVRGQSAAIVAATLVARRRRKTSS